MTSKAQRLDFGSILQRVTTRAISGIRETLRDAEICVGLRNLTELAAAREEQLVDLIVWIDRDVSPDPTLEFGPDLCDVVVQNRGAIEAFYQRLSALARWARILNATSASPRVQTERTATGDRRPDSDTDVIG